MIKRIYVKSILFIVLLSLLVSSCAKLPEPAFPGENITKNETPEQFNFRKAGLDEVVVNIKKNFPAMRTILLIKDNTLIYEWNRQGVDPDEIVEVHSGAKIVTALLTGIAIDQGLFKDEHTTIKDVFYMKEYSKEPELDSAIFDVTLDSLLTMRSNIQFSDMYLSFSVIKERSKHDFNVFQSIINLPVSRKERAFLYETESYVAINGMIIEASGMSDFDYVVKNLFTPLSITSYAYTSDYVKMGNACWELYLRPMDFAKIGLLIMNRGVYKGTQIVSSEWVEACMSYQTKGLGVEYTGQEELEFGYALWRCKFNDLDVVYSYGKNGQYLLMIPEKNLLIVTTSDEKDLDLFYRNKLLEWILTAEIK